MIRLGTVEHKCVRRYRAVNTVICSTLVLRTFFPGNFAEAIAGRLIGRVQDSRGEWL